MKKKLIKENLHYWIGAIIVLLILCFALLYFSEAQIPTVFTSSGIVAIISAFIGVALTVVVTSILLNQQSEAQEKFLKQQTDADKEKDKFVKIFEEKLKIYKEFLSNLNEVIKGDKISDNDVKNLIFQISYVAMHTSSERVNGILSQLNKTIDEIGSNEKRYEKLAKYILDIVIELQHELYGNRLGASEIDTKIFGALVTNIEGANAVNQQLNETTNIDKIGLQTYFWTELLKQLKLINPTYSYDWTEEKIKEDVALYYSRARNRHRYFGFEFDIYTSKKLNRSVRFEVQIENDYYYGFYWSNEPQTDDKLSQVVKQIYPKYKSNKFWAGWRWPDYSNEEERHDLDFWKFNQHAGMKRLMDPDKRAGLIEDIAKEMDGQIRKFIEIAEKEGL